MDQLKYGATTDALAADFFAKREWNTMGVVLTQGKENTRETWNSPEIFPFSLFTLAIGIHHMAWPNSMWPVRVLASILWYLDSEEHTSENVNLLVLNHRHILAMKVLLDNETWWHCMRATVSPRTQEWFCQWMISYGEASHTVWVPRWSCLHFRHWRSKLDIQLVK